MVVDHADGLHVGVDHRRPDDAEAAAREIAAEGIGLGGGCRNLAHGLPPLEVPAVIMGRHSPCAIVIVAHQRIVIVFTYPEEPERDFIKRVIGLPGETLEVRNKNVFINGTPLNEPYVHFIFPPHERAPGDASSDHGEKSDYGSGHRTGVALLHDGRQPGQLQGQPVLGLHAGGLCQGLLGREESIRSRC